MVWRFRKVLHGRQPAGRVWGRRLSHALSQRHDIVRAALARLVFWGSSVQIAPEENAGGLSVVGETAALGQFLPALG